MNREQLYQEIQKKKSFLCVGLDSDIQKLPIHLGSLPNALLAFNKAIIDYTADHCVAYKLNTAFYESLGSIGWQIMEKTLEYIPDNIFTIADAKRGDIGNTVNMYAQAFFKHMNFDAVTVAPYMGRDSVDPFLEYEDKWVILLALTSNKSSKDFQHIQSNGKALFEHVLITSSTWGSADQIMYVVGGTQADYLERVRKLVPDHFLLVPGIGAQGGDANAVISQAKNNIGGLLINSSRGIIYASNGTDFAQESQKSAKALNDLFRSHL